VRRTAAPGHFFSLPRSFSPPLTYLGPVWASETRRCFLAPLSASPRSLSSPPWYILRTFFFFGVRSPSTVLALVKVPHFLTSRSPRGFRLHSPHYGNPAHPRASFRPPSQIISSDGTLFLNRHLSPRPHWGAKAKFFFHKTGSSGPPLPLLLWAKCSAVTFFCVC